VRSELLAEQIGLGADSLDQLVDPADVALRGVELVAEPFHAFKSRADFVGVGCR